MKCLLKYFFQLAALISITVAMLGCGSSFYKDKIGSYLGLKKVYFEQIYGEETVGGIRGKGHSVEVYKISKESVDQFLALPTKIFRDSSAAKNLEIGWLHSPVDSAYKKGIIFNLNFDARMKKYEKETYDLLFSGGEYYYAIRYKNSKVIRNSGSIELFVLNPTTKILYIVETAD